MGEHRSSSRRSPEASSSQRRDRDSRSRSPEERSKRRSHSHRDRSSHRDEDPPRSSRRDDDSHRKSKSKKDADRPLPPGVPLLTTEDYFLRSTELKVWLSEVKDSRLDQLSGDDARRRFKQFVRAWNAGRLEDKFYDGIKASQIGAGVSSGFAWKFGNATERELDDAASIRKGIDSTVTSSRPGARAGPSSTQEPRRTIGPTMGPTMPPSHGSALEALQFSRANDESSRNAARSAQRSEYSRENREARTEEKDGRATGRERVMEKKSEQRAIGRERQEVEGGMQEVDDDTLMGGGSSFQAMYVVASRPRALD